MVLACLSADSDSGLNSRFVHCFQQEDWNRFAIRVASRAHVNTLELALLHGVYLRLRFGSQSSSESEDMWRFCLRCLLLGKKMAREQAEFAEPRKASELPCREVLLYTCFGILYHIHSFCARISLYHVFGTLGYIYKYVIMMKICNNYYFYHLLLLLYIYTHIGLYTCVNPPVTVPMQRTSGDPSSAPKPSGRLRRSGSWGGVEPVGA